MANLKVGLIIAAVVCSIIAAITGNGRVGWAGLACFAASFFPL